MKPTREVCECGAEYVRNSLRVRRCPRCSTAWKSCKGLVRKAIAAGLVKPAEKADVFAQLWARRLAKLRQTPSQYRVVRCPYCGKEHDSLDEVSYCNECKTYGLDRLHKATGRTNGWDTPATATRRIARAVDGWRGRPVMGGTKVPKAIY